MELINLNEYKKNVYSQFGEDGILEKVFETLDISQGFFVEFGAWDGMHLSNTYNLYKHKNWEGIYIEGSSKRYKDLLTNIPENRVIKLNKFVEASGPNSLENILKESKTKPNFDVLSIDIDSDDLVIWKSLRSFRPKIVIIEYNPTIPYDVRFENTKGRNLGNAPLSIFEHAVSINYNLIGVTGTNLIFLDNQIDSANRFLKQDLSEFLSYNSIRYFWGYDGSLLVSCNGEVFEKDIYIVPWTNIPFFQPIKVKRTLAMRSNYLRYITFVKEFIFHPFISISAFKKSKTQSKNASNSWIFYN